MARPIISPRVKLMRIVFSILGVIATPLAVMWAYRIWFRSPRYQRSRREQQWGEQSRRRVITSRFGKVMTYHWGDADHPRVFLLHGWSGRGLQLGAFVAPLLAAGYSVTSFDAPGHGESDGKATNLFQIAEVLRQVVLEAKQPYALIAHSFGCMVSSYALREYHLPIKKMIAISSPTSPEYLLQGFVELLQFDAKITAGFVRKYKRDFGDDVYVRTRADRNLSDWPGRLLVIHDKNDEVVDWQYGELLATEKPESKVLYTHSLGHRRILRNEQVITASIDFLKRKTNE